jgi:ABC-type phosphate/phosphonate transport system ATPase subunit
MAGGRVVFDGPPEALKAPAIQQIYGRPVIEAHERASEDEGLLEAVA